MPRSSALRGALYGSQAGFDGDEGDIDYTFDLIWDSFLLGIDIHRGKGPFRLSGGYLRSDPGGCREARVGPVRSLGFVFRF